MRLSEQRRWKDHQDSGFTLIEVCIVVTILIVLFAIGFSIAAPAREKGRQTACLSQLRQIFAAMNMYANDNAGAAITPEIDLPEQAITDPDLLSPYGAGKEIMFCPDTPGCAKRGYTSSYVWNWMPSRQASKWPNAYEAMLKEASELGSMYPIVYCTVHDEIFYHPSEAALNDQVNPPFLIDLHGDGSAQAHRRQMPRPLIIKHACAGFDSER